MPDSIELKLDRILMELSAVKVDIAKLVSETENHKEAFNRFDSRMGLLETELNDVRDKLASNSTIVKALTFCVGAFVTALAIAVTSKFID